MHSNGFQTDSLYYHTWLTLWEEMARGPVFIERETPLKAIVEHNSKILSYNRGCGEMSEDNALSGERE